MLHDVNSTLSMLNVFLMKIVMVDNITNVNKINYVYCKHDTLKHKKQLDTNSHFYSVFGLAQNCCWVVPVYNTPIIRWWNIDLQRPNRYGDQTLNDIKIKQQKLFSWKMYVWFLCRFTVCFFYCVLNLWWMYIN